MWLEINTSYTRCKVHQLFNRWTNVWGFFYLLLRIFYANLVWSFDKLISLYPICLFVLLEFRFMLFIIVNIRFVPIFVENFGPFWSSICVIIIYCVIVRVTGWQNGCSRSKVSKRRFCIRPCERTCYLAIDCSWSWRIERISRLLLSQKNMVSVECCHGWSFFIIRSALLWE